MQNKLLKINYAKQRNLECYQNAQQWYYVNAINKVKTAKNPLIVKKYKIIVDYYSNGKAIIN